MASRLTDKDLLRRQIALDFAARLCVGTAANLVASAGVIEDYLKYGKPVNVVAKR